MTRLCMPKVAYLSGYEPTNLSPLLWAGPGPQITKNHAVTQPCRMPSLVFNGNELAGLQSKLMALQ